MTSGKDNSKKEEEDEEEENYYNVYDYPISGQVGSKVSYD